MDYKSFFAIEKRMKTAGMDIDRAELVADYTEGRTESLKDLSPFEYRGLIKALNTLLGAKDYPRDVKDQMRSKVIAILCNLGYTKDDKPDMIRINHWCVTHGHGKCELNQYSQTGLSKLIYQAEAMLKKTIEKL